MKGGKHVHVHVVQKGDTLWKISRQYGVSFDEVKRLNAHLANPDYIVPGMKIFVPETAKKQEVKEHPYYDGRPVKSKKEEMIVQPIPKAVTQPTPTPTPAPAPAPIPQPVAPIMQQPTPQPIPMPYPYPFSQDISMTNIMPQMMSIPYGWIPVPDMDTHPIPQPMPQKPKPMPQKPQPLPQKTQTMPVYTPPVVPAPPTPAPIKGWKLHDSSSLMDSSSLHHPVLPEQVQPQTHPAEGYGPCECGHPAYVRPMSPCGCGRPPMAYAMSEMNYGDNENMSNGLPEQTLGAYQEPNMMMPNQTLGAYQEPNMMMAHHPYMMAPQHQMMPYMACMPCHMCHAPHGPWGYPYPGRQR